ncbi:MAG: hypothetical protein HY910_14680 [Desulfarculus sp.]|nr:hypothetical protein [Desulfarculus sp.]
MDIVYKAMITNPGCYIIIIWGSLISAVGGAILIYPIMALIYKKSGTNAQKEAHSLALVLGLIERVFLALSVCFSAYVMVGAWLVLKGIVKADMKTDSMKELHIYLIGNCLSLTVASICGFLMQFFVARVQQ